MHKMIGLIIRICKQMINDKRSLAMMFVIPLVIMVFLYLILGETSITLKVGLINGNTDITKVFEENAKVVDISSSDDVDEFLKDGTVDAIINFDEEIKISTLENNSTYLTEINDMLSTVQKDLFNQKEVNVNYVYGQNLKTMFDKLVYVLLGVISFFLVFIIAGISFVRERTMGTLERFMLTPIKRSAVVLGYTIGLGIFAAIQSVLLLFFVRFVLGVTYEGSMLNAIIIMILLAFAAVAMGAFFSIFAQTEFQIVQFIPIVIIPQIFYSGLLSLDSLPFGLENLKFIMPIYYGCEGLKSILIKGEGFSDILLCITMLAVYVIVFSVINTISLKKYRAA